MESNLILLIENILKLELHKRLELVEFAIEKGLSQRVINTMLVYCMEV